MTHTAKQVQAIKAALGMVYDAIVSEPQGAPAGVIYAALMHGGCTLSQYESMERILVASKVVRKEGDLLFATDPTRKSLNLNL